MTTDYQVHLDAFEGPLDLLLFLIRRAEVEITDIPVAVIADQFIETLRDIDAIDIDKAGEFLVMAATLTEIKARMLAPPVQTAEGEEGAAQTAGAATPILDPRTELVRQLLEYKRYRDAAAALNHQRDQWEARYPSGKAIPEPEAYKALIQAKADEAANAGLDMEDVTLQDLVDAFSKVLSSVDFNRLGEHRVVVDETPIELHAEDIIDLLKRESHAADSNAAAGSSGGVPFQRVFAGRTRNELIGLFLAMLELVRQRRVKVRQDAIHGTISLSLEEQGAEPAAGAVAVPVPTGD